MNRYLAAFALALLTIAHAWRGEVLGWFGFACCAGFLVWLITNPKIGGRR